MRSAAVLGIAAYDVTVEVDVAQGLPQFTIVGLPAGAVRESRERVTAALINSGFSVPPRRVTVNLAPADVRKDGTAFDLPIALGILIATRQLDPAAVSGRVFVGELGLDGTVRRVRGALPIARCVAAHEGLALVLPLANAAEAQLVRALRLGAPPSLRALIADLRAGRLSPPAAVDGTTSPPMEPPLDLADLVGQDGARRALEVAAAGGHNLLLVGPPGAGKTMLARRLPSVLPPLSEGEALEVIAIHSVAGVLPADARPSFARPFRAPHHSISGAGLIGGGTAPRPGEVSLAHHGVLFLDEMLEFPRAVLDALRQPLEHGRVVIARASSAIEYPSRFTLIGATNPCPCGRAGDPSSVCICSAADVVRYRGRLSGPLADRIDMHVTVGRVPVRDLSIGATGESSAAVRQRVARARERQRARFAGLAGVATNAHAPGRWIDANTRVHTAARELLATAADRLGLSARGYHRVLRVARTIADLVGDDAIASPHVAEALRYRAGVPEHAPAHC